MNTVRRSSSVRETRVRTLRGLLGAGLTAVLIAVMGVAGAAPASAAQGTRPCPSYYYCFYEHTHYNNYGNGTGWKLQYQSTTQGHFRNPPASSGDRRDQLSSMINNTGNTICLYNERSLRVDEKFRVAPYQDILSFHDSGWGDKLDYWSVRKGNVTCPDRHSW